MSKVIRSVKNVTKGYSSVQVKVRNATSNDPWGPTGTDMSEIAQMTYNSSTDFFEIMDMLDKRLNDKGKNWRHVLKALKVLDYSLHEGSELVVTWAKKNVYIIKTLREFQYIDEDGRDVGQNVRVSAKELTSLILDEERLKSERKDRKTWKSRVTGIEEFGPDHGESSPNPSRRKPERRDRRADEEEAEYRLAIEASKAEAEDDQRRRQKAAAPPDDDDLQKALKLSKEEEDLRRRELEESNANALFDDTPVQPNPVQFTGANQGYTQQTAVDWFGNPIDNQTTGYLNNVYNPNMQAQPTGYQQNQPTGFQPQPTGYQNGFQTGYQQQPQATGFDPQQAFGNAMYQGQPGYGQQPQSGYDAFGAQAQPQPDSSPAMATGTNNPWGASKPAHEALAPAPTGSNNPFASSFTRPQPSQPTLGTLTEQKTQTQFNNHSFNPPVSFATPPPQPSLQQQPPQAQPVKEQDPHHAQLNALLAAGEGQDTFGNVGNLRIPAQHTAPGTFINSAGQGLDRLHANQTGNNPFFNQQQFTGGAQVQQGYGLANSAGLGQARMAPAQTGPAAGFGGSPSPFGSSQAQNPYQRPVPGQGGNSLIDL